MRIITSACGVAHTHARCVGHERRIHVHVRVIRVAQNSVHTNFLTLRNIATIFVQLRTSPSLQDIMDTRQKNLCAECVNKETSIRFAWHMKYGRQFGKKSFDPKPKKIGLNLNTTISEKIKRMDRERKPLKSAADAKRESTGQVKCGGSIPLRDMRPPSPSAQSLLYNGISTHGEGRYAYLKKRKTLTPVQKYEFPLLSSYQYGWKIMEYAGPKPSPHARIYIDSLFYRKRGITFG